MRVKEAKQIPIKPTVIAIVFAALYGAIPSAHAGALPTGGRFVAGNGSIAQSGNSVTINQNSSRGVVDWNSFSIDRGNAVTFNNGTGATLNRVTGGDTSMIMGALSATGSVYLINPQGVVIGNNGTVTTGGRFVASTLDTDNASFMNGGPLTFTGSSSRRVVNLGQIGSTHGDVFLVSAAEVDNFGGISAPDGTAEIAAGRKILLQDSSTGRQVFVQSGSHGTVWNQGDIAAAQINLQAADGNIFALAGNHAAPRATGTATRDGHIWIVADQGNVNLSGLFSAYNANDSSGGTIDTVARNLAFPDIGPTVIGGVWNITTPSYKLGAPSGRAFAQTLNGGTAINVQTTGADGSNGNIEVASNLGWDGAGSLTLGAYNTVTVDPGVTIRNQANGNLTLRADNTGIDNGGSVINNGSIDWSKSTGIVNLLYDMNGSYAAGTQLANANWKAPAFSALTTQMTAYQLVNSWADIDNVGSLPASTYSTNYALGKDFDASVFGMAIGYNGLEQPKSPFEGQFDGMGHTIENGTVPGGLFGLIGQQGVVRNLTMTNTGRDFGLVEDPAGILASVSQGTISNVFVSGNMVGYTSAAGNSGGPPVGGLVGINEGLIERSGSSATISNNGVSGGLVGGNTGSIVQSFASGNVSGDSITEPGGLVGDNAGSISQSYATGTVSGLSYYAGGLVATNSGTIDESFATTNVTSIFIDPHYPPQLGGIAGANTGTIGQNVYWDVDTTGQASGGPGTLSANGLSHAQMSNPASFPGWDFSSGGVWAMPSGAAHPVLRWQLQPSSNAGGGAAL